MAVRIQFLHQTILLFLFLLNLTKNIIKQLFKLLFIFLFIKIINSFIKIVFKKKSNIILNFLYYLMIFVNCCFVKILHYMIVVFNFWATLGRRQGDARKLLETFERHAVYVCKQFTERQLFRCPFFRRRGLSHIRSYKKLVRNTYSYTTNIAKELLTKINNFYDFCFLIFTENRLWVLSRGIFTKIIILCKLENVVFTRNSKI